jgi:hypothetical protein
MLGAGLLLFVLSFFLRAVVGAGVGGGPLLGYQCAGLALLVPWTDIGKSLLDQQAREKGAEHDDYRRRLPPELSDVNQLQALAFFSFFFPHL